MLSGARALARNISRGDVWRNKVAAAPANARSPGTMESDEK